MRRALLSLALAAYAACGYAQTNQSLSPALEKVRQRAEQGDVAAQIKLGGALSSGSGATRDEVGAAYWMRKAADRGEPIAQTQLGCMYAQGRGVERDDAEA